RGLSDPFAVGYALLLFLKAHPDRSARCDGRHSGRSAQAVGQEIALASGTGGACRRMVTALPMRLLLAVIAMVLWPFQAFACSRAEGEEFDTPSNFELVQQADLIVLGRIASPSRASGPIDSLLLEPVEVLKGELPDEPLIVGGMTD